MTQTEHKWTMENSKQIVDKQTHAVIKTKRETNERQRQLTCQVLGELEKLLEETQSQTDEIDYLKTNTEQQQEHIDRLTAEKHEQYLLIKRLRLQIENLIEKLEENKNEASQEKMQFLKMQTEICQVRETLERRHNELINERHKLEMIKYDQTKESKGPMEQIKREQEITAKIMADSLLSLIKENKKGLLEAKQVKEQMKKNMADIKQEIKINTKVILQHQEKIYHIKHNMNINISKMKQWWTKTQSRERQKEEKRTTETVKVNFSRIQEEMEKLWEMLEEDEPQLKVTVREVQELKKESRRVENIKSDSQKQRENTKTTHWETDMQKQHPNLEKTLALVQSEEDDIQNIKTKILTDSENIERDRQVAQAEMNTMKSEQGTSEMQTQGLDDKLQRTKKEIREMEVKKIKMIRMSKRTKEEFSRMVEETEAAKQDMEGRQAKTKKQRSEHTEDRFDEQKIIIQQVDRTRDIIQHKENQFEEANIDLSNNNEVNTDMKRGMVEVEEIKKMLCRVREDAEQSRRDFTEEKSQIQWKNFQVKKKRRELDQRLERTMRERDEVEIMKVKIQQQGKEVEQKLEDTMSIIRTVSEIKASMEKAAAEMNITREDMLKVQRKMDQNKEEVKKYLAKMTSMKAQVSKWILTGSAGNTSKHQKPQKETDHVKDQTFEIPTDKEDVEEEMTKDTMSLQQFITLEDWQRSEEVKEQEDMHSKHEQRHEIHFPAVDMKEEYNVFLQMQAIIHEETLMDDDQRKCVQLRQMEDLNYKIEAKKQELENIHLLISQGRAHLIQDEIDTERDNMTKNRKGKEMENEIFQLRSEKDKLEKDILLTKNSLDPKNCELEQLKKSICEEVIERNDIKMLNQHIQIQGNVRVERQAEAEIHKMNHLRESMERQKMELDDKMQMTKREIREMELLKSELEMKKRESKHIFRKSMQIKEESEIKWNDLRREKKVLRRETKKRRRELEQRLEETMREMDESEILRIKLQQQKEALDEEKQRFKDQTTLLQVSREDDEQSLEKHQLKKIREEVKMIQQISKATDSITDLPNMTQKIHVNLGMMQREMVILENVNVYLGEQREGLKTLTTENRTVRDKMSQIKYQLKIDLKKRTIQAKAEMNEMIHMQNNIQKQKQGIEIRLEEVKRERREMEVLKSELKMEKIENQQIIRKGIQREQEGKKMCAQVKVEKDALKRETQKRKKELDQRLERINRERDELEIMQLKMQREKDRSKGAMVNGGSFTPPNLVQKQWKLIQTGMEKYNVMKKQSEDVNEYFKDQKRHMETQAKNLIQGREEVKNIKMDIQRQKEIMICALKNMKQMQTHLGKEKLNVIKVNINQSIKKEKKRIIEKSEDLLLREKELSNEQLLKNQVMMLKHEQQKEKKEQNEVKRWINDTASEKEIKVPRTKRKLMQKKGDVEKEIMEEVQSGKRHHEEEVLINENIPSSDSEDTLYLQLNQPFEVGIKEKADILGTEIKLHIKPEITLRKNKLNCKRKHGEENESSPEIQDIGLAKREELEPDKTEEKSAKSIKLLEREGLIRISNVVIGKDDVKEKWKLNSDNKYGDLEKLKIEIAHKKEDKKNVHDNIVKGKKLDLEQMKSDRNNEIERDRRVMKVRKDKLKITMTQLKGEEENISSFLDEINREKRHIEEVTLQLQKDRDTLQNNMEMIILKQKEQELKEDEYKRQTQELESSKNSVLAEREKLDLWRKDLNNKKEEVEAAMNSINGEREQLSQMKSSTDMDRHRLDTDKDRMEGERSDLKIREDQLVIKMKSIETLREKVQQLNAKMSEDMTKKMERLQQNNEDAVMLYSVLEEKLAAQDEQKENMACYTELMEREKKSLRSILSDMVIQREGMQNQWKQKFDLDKQDGHKLKAELKQDRDDLDRENELMNKEKLELELMRSEIQKQRDMLEQEKEDMKGQRFKLEITKTELQKKKELADSQLDEIQREKGKIEEVILQLQTDRDTLQNNMDMIILKQKEQELKEDEYKKQTQELESSKNSVLAERDKLDLWRKDLNNKKEEFEAAMNSINGEREQLSQMKNSTDMNRHRLDTDKDRMEGERSELKPELSSIVHSMQRLKPKANQLNQSRHEDFLTNMDRSGQKYVDMLHFDCLQNHKNQIVTVKFDKEVQTEIVKEWLQEKDVEKQDLNKLLECICEKTVLKFDVAIQTEKFEHQLKLEGDTHNFGRQGIYLKTERDGLLMLTKNEVKHEQKLKLATIFESVLDQDDFIDLKMSKRDCLRKIWKDTKMEQKEIDQLKRISHEMRIHLEKRLKVISHFVKIKWSQNEKEPLENKMKKGRSKDMTSQSERVRGCTTIDEIYTELQQFEDQMLSEKLCVKEKVSRTLITSHKANQTFQVDIFKGNATVPVTEHAFAKTYQGQMKVEETEAAPEMSSGLLCQLQHYCYRCCCHCCACCKPVFKDK